MAGAGYVASKRAVLAMTVALREEVPDHIDVRLICPGLVKSELSRETSEGVDTDAYASAIIKQIAASEFFIVSHAFTIVRIKARLDGLENAYAKHAPRYEGDDEFDVRTLGAKQLVSARAPDRTGPSSVTGLNCSSSYQQYSPI